MAFCIKVLSANVQCSFNQPGKVSIWRQSNLSTGLQTELSHHTISHNLMMLIQKYLSSAKCLKVCQKTATLKKSFLGQIFISLNSLDEMMEIGCCNMQLCKIDMDNHLHCGKWYRIALSYHMNNGIGHFRWRCCLQKKTGKLLWMLPMSTWHIEIFLKWQNYQYSVQSWLAGGAYVYFWRHPNSIQFYKYVNLYIYSLRKNVLMWYAREGSKGSFL